MNRVFASSRAGIAHLLKTELFAWLNYRDDRLSGAP